MGLLHSKPAASSQRPSAWLSCKVSGKAARKKKLRARLAAPQPWPDQPYPMLTQRTAPAISSTHDAPPVLLPAVDSGKQRRRKELEDLDPMLLGLIALGERRLRKRASCSSSCRSRTAAAAAAALRRASR